MPNAKIEQKSLMDFGKSRTIIIIIIIIRRRTRRTRLTGVTR